jgi:hypothetical protein
MCGPVPPVVEPTDVDPPGWFELVLVDVEVDVEVEVEVDVEVEPGCSMGGWRAIAAPPIASANKTAATNLMVVSLFGQP